MANWNLKKVEKIKAIICDYLFRQWVEKPLEEL